MTTRRPGFVAASAISQNALPISYPIIFDVTVASGTVSADLTDFPLMIDLADMPGDFWTHVNADGGSIRVYEDDDTTQLPFDVTFIDKVTQQGRLYIKRSLSTGLDTTISIHVLAPGTSGLAPTDPYGRNAVWSDFDVVVVFPELINRVDGSAASTSGANVFVEDTMSFKETFALDINLTQGVAYDGTHYYGVTTNGLTKYNTSGALQTSNADPVGDVNTDQSIANLNHCGAPDIIDGELWVPVQEYPNSPYDTQYIGRFSLTDLTLIGSFELTGATDRESSGVYYDALLDRLYVTDFVDSSTIPYFNKTTGAYVGTITPSSALDNIQGMTELNGKYYVNCSGSGSTPGVWELEKDGTVNGQVIETGYTGDEESVFAYNGELIHGQDSGWLRHYKKDARQDWARIHGTPQGYTVTHSSIWTMAVSWNATPVVGQMGLIGAASAASPSSDRHSLMFDAGPDRIDMWNTNDSWFAPSPDTNPVAFDIHRAAGAQNGTTERALFVNGVKEDTDAPCTIRPTVAGGDIEVFIAGGSGSEPGYGNFQYAWFRKEYMSDAWMAADADNMNNPSAFYSVEVRVDPSTTDYATMAANLTCVGAWGTLLRNHAYTGPAMRVEDNSNPGTTTDIYFDNTGLIRGTRPYGDDTRVVTLYDQFGTSDLFAVLGDNITIRENDSIFGTWLLDFNASGELTSTDVTGGGHPWEVGDGVWALGFKRVDDSATRLIWGIGANSNFMKMGVWHEQRDLHWRVNSGNASDWLNTDWITDAENVRADEIERAIGDMSNGSPAQAWYKGVASGTRSFTAPVTYDSGHGINIGGGILSDYTGYFSELAIFDPASAMLVAEKDLLDEALAEADFFVTGQEVQTFEHRAHLILGGPPGDVLAARAQRQYVVLGGAPEVMSAKTHRLHTVLGGAPDKMATRSQRLHAIIVP